MKFGPRIGSFLGLLHDAWALFDSVRHLATFSSVSFPPYSKLLTCFDLVLRYWRALSSVDQIIRFSSSCPVVAYGYGYGMVYSGDELLCDELLFSDVLGLVRFLSCLYSCRQIELARSVGWQTFHVHQSLGASGESRIRRNSWRTIHIEPSHLGGMAIKREAGCRLDRSNR